MKSMRLGFVFAPFCYFALIRARVSHGCYDGGAARTKHVVGSVKIDFEKENNHQQRHQTVFVVGPSVTVVDGGGKCSSS